MSSSDNLTQFLAALDEAQRIDDALAANAQRREEIRLEQLSSNNPYASKGELEHINTQSASLRYAQEANNSVLSRLGVPFADRLESVNRQIALEAMACFEEAKAAAKQELAPYFDEQAIGAAVSSSKRVCAAVALEQKLQPQFRIGRFRGANFKILVQPESARGLIAELHAREIVLRDIREGGSR